MLLTYIIYREGFEKKWKDGKVYQSVNWIGYDKYVCKNWKTENSDLWKKGTDMIIGWRMKDEGWRMKGWGWKMKDEGWRMKNEGWRMKRMFDVLFQIQK